MKSGRTYADACGVAHALDLVGERWALLIARELMLGPKRYTDLMADLPGISTNILAARLDGLEEAGVVTRRRLPPPAASNVYELTEWGLQLEPVMSAIGRWGARSPLHDRTAHFGVASFVLSLRTNFSKQAAAGLRAAVEFQLGDDVFTARVRSGRFTIERGAADAPDAVITGAPPVLAGVIYGGYPLAAAIQAGDLHVSGDTGIVEGFFKVFVLPPPAPAPPAIA